MNSKFTMQKILFRTQSRQKFQTDSNVRWQCWFQYSKCSKSMLILLRRFNWDFSKIWAKFIWKIIIVGPDLGSSIEPKISRANIFLKFFICVFFWLAKLAGLAKLNFPPRERSFFLSHFHPHFHTHSHAHSHYQRKYKTTLLARSCCGRNSLKDLACLFCFVHSAFAEWFCVLLLALLCSSSQNGKQNIRSRIS